MTRLSAAVSLVAALHTSRATTGAPGNCHDRRDPSLTSLRERQPQTLSSGEDGNRRRSVCSVAVPLRFAVLISVLAGCGGGGGSGSELPTASLTVAVSDVFGEPAEHAQVEVIALSTGKTLKAGHRSAGRVRFARIPAGTASIHASDDPLGDVALSGSSGHIELAGGAALDVNVALRPEGDPFAAVRASWVEASGASADGGSVNMSFNLYSFTNVQGLYLVGCEPDDADDTPLFRSNCVKDPVAFDAPYDAPGFAELLGTPVPGGAAAPFSVAVLLDQGRAISLNDSSDVRLFAVKYFLSMLQAEDRVLLTAFASDDAAGPRALLPHQPVSMLPDDVSPTFAASDRAMLFPLVDSLAALEGGASQLYAAIDRMLDFTAQNTLPGTRRAVVVCTTDADKTCGSADQCLSARQALVSKARATGVSIVVIGLGSESEPVDVVALSELAAGTSGALLWTNYPRQLPALFRGLLQILDGSAETFVAHYRIQSLTDGVFRPDAPFLERSRWSSISARSTVSPSTSRLPPEFHDSRAVIDPSFHDLYLKARLLCRNGFSDGDHLGAAVSMLEAVVAAAPRFARAWAELARARARYVCRDLIDAYASVASSTQLNGALQDRSANGWQRMWR